MDMAIEPKAGDFELGGLVRAAASEFESTAQKKGVGLTVCVDPRAERAVRGDEERLHEMLGQLLSDAVEHTQRGGIRLAVKALGGDRYRLRVVNTDLGLDERRAVVGALGRLARELGAQFEANCVPCLGSQFSLALELPAAH